jgi:hypothetical protein
MKTPYKLAFRTKPIALAVVVGGVLVWLGWLILRGAISRSRVE